MKNIRIDDDLYQQIKTMADLEDRTVQAQVHRLLRERFGNTRGGQNNTAPETLEVPYQKLGGTPPSGDVADLINSDAKASVPIPKYDPTVAERQLSGELPCCSNETKPCRHWVWDVASGEGYVNTLSGRQKEAE